MTRVPWAGCNLPSQTMRRDGLQIIALNHRPDDVRLKALTNRPDGLWFIALTNRPDGVWLVALNKQGRWRVAYSINQQATNQAKRMSGTYITSVRKAKAASMPAQAGGGLQSGMPLHHQYP